MIRRLAGVMAAALLLCAGLLVGSGATVAFADETMTCAGPIVSAESQTGGRAQQTDPVAKGLMRECERTDSRRLRLALLASLLALAAGAVCTSGRNGSPDNSPRVEARV